MLVDGRALEGILPGEAYFLVVNSHGEERLILLDQQVCPHAMILETARRGRPRAHGRHGRAHQPGHFQVDEALRPALKVLDGQPLVPLDGEALKQPLVLSGHLNGVDRDREVRLVLRDRQQRERGVPDHGRPERLAERGGGNVDAGLFAQLAGAGLGKGLAARPATADREPVPVLAAMLLSPEGRTPRT